MTARIGKAIAGALGALALVVPGARADFLGPQVADGPSPDIGRLGGLDMAHDGTGSLAYLKRDVDGMHVFAERLVEGSPQPPGQRVDVGQVGDSSDARIAVGQNDQAVVSWIHAGTLWAALRAGPTSPWGPPIRVYSGPVPPSDPSLDLSLLGTAYLSFTAGTDVLVARMPYQTPNAWTVLPRPLDIAPADVAGHSDVAASADGSAVVVWVENAVGAPTHVWERRVNEDGALSDFPREASVPSLSGRPGGAADSPSVTIEDWSSFAFVAFRQDFVNGATTVSRAVGRRLAASQFESPHAIDGIGWNTTDGAASSDIFISGRGYGAWATALRSGGVAGGGITRKGDIGAGWYRPLRLDAGGNTAPPPITTTMGESISGVVAWQQSTPGLVPTLMARHWDENHFESAVALSPAFGPAAADLGLDSAADGRSDFVIGFVQGDPSARRIVTITYDGLIRPAAIPTDDRWTRQRRPRLKWRAVSNVIWGPVRYRIDIDGIAYATTSHTSWRPRKPLPDGAHDIEILQIDGRGQASPGIPRTRRIDTHGPHVTLRRARGGFRLSADDGGAIKGSGVAALRVLFAGRSQSIRVPAIGIVQNAFVSGRPRRIVAVDKIGNRTSVSAAAALRRGGAP